MARRSHDGYSNSADGHGPDLTAQFWGSAPAWRTIGTHPRQRRNGDRTGPIARTRRHGDRTGQIPVVPLVPIEEPLIDPYDFGFDDVGYGPDPGIAGRRIDTGGPTSRHGAAQPEFVEIELDEDRVGRPGDAVSTLAQRLGLGAVDPLLLRLGVIVMIGVLLVPLAMGMRSDSSKGAVRTELAAAPPTELVAPGDVPVVEEVPPILVTDNGADSSSELQTSNESGAPTTSSSVAEVAAATESAAATAQPETTASAGDVAELAEGSGLDEVDTVPAPRAMAQTATEAAEADEPANRIAPVCQLAYTVAAGDYWIRIADAAGTTLAKLLEANLATVLTPIYPGDDICLPDGATLPSPPTATTAASPTTSPVTTPPTTAAPTSTTAPTTTVPVTAPPAPGVVEAIIREVWPDDLEDKALEIAWRESGYRPSARNWCCYGLFQIHWNAHRSWLDDMGVTSATQLLDANTNARAAYALYQRSGGWGPWGG